MSNVRSWSVLIGQSQIDYISKLCIKNNYRYLVVLPKFVKNYIDTVHTTTGMAPSNVTDADVLAIWCRIEAKRQSFRVASANFRVGQHVCISKEKIKFAKATE